MNFNTAWLLLTTLTLCLNPVAGFQMMPHKSVSSVRSSSSSSSSSRESVRLQSTVIATGTRVETLLNPTNQKRVDALAKIAPDVSEIQRLRFVMAFPNQTEAEKAVRDMVAWRQGAGKKIVEAAAEAVAKATANGGWDNDAVRDMAPHASGINQFITPKNIITMSMEDGDLLYVIRASAIDDKGLMKKVSVQQMVDFFAYVKEVHSIIANMRSEKSGRLSQVIFANDISGIRQPPDKNFSKALSNSSKQYEGLYPSLAGPTMILNLPFILQAFVALFKPLFPKTVQERLKFVRAPVLASLKELTPLSTNDSQIRSFLNEIKRLLRN